jgi:hypothetical protein
MKVFIFGVIFALGVMAYGLTDMAKESRHVRAIYKILN